MEPWAKVSDFGNIRHFELRFQGLPEGNFEELSKNVEDIPETKFPALLNGTNIMEVR